MDGLPELGIMENVTCEERETFVDDNNTVKTGTAKNRTDIVSDSWCAPLRSVEANVSSRYPVELGFLEFVPNETINIAVDKGDVKKEKKKAFTLLWEELKEKLMYKSVDSVFEDVNKS